MLRAGVLTLQAMDAVGGFAAFFCRVCIASLRVVQLAEDQVSVHCLEDGRNVDGHRAAVCAVMAGCALDLRD